MKKTIKSIFYILVLTLSMVSISYSESLYQIVQANSDKDLINNGELLIVNAIHTVSDNNTKLSGIGIRIHFNSNLLEFISIDDYFVYGRTGTPLITSEENYSEDDDPLTDSIIVMGWATIGSSWPMIEGPVELIRIIFRAKQPLAKVETYINITHTSKDSRYLFEGINRKVTISGKFMSDFNHDNVLDIIDVMHLLHYLVTDQ